MRAALLVTAVTLVVSGCSPSALPEGPVAERSASPSPDTPFDRPPTGARTRVDNVALGGAATRVATAVGDLKDVRLWRGLTRGLFVARIGVRTGRAGVPADGHLAEARISYWSDEDGAGRMCHVILYAQAVMEDLARQRAYAAEGRLEGPLPSLRELWAAVLAHELAHCLDGGTEEAAARAWERRALGRLIGADLSRSH